MPVPTHRPDCKTQIWKTRCHDCGSVVYYFSCSCGSKVFFDTKGPPWTEHGDHCPRYQIRLLLKDGYSAGTIQRLLEQRSQITGNPVPVEIINYLHQLGAPGKKIYHDILPSAESCEIKGVVQEIREINFFSRLTLEKNYFTQKVLGNFANKNWLEVIVHSEHDETIRIIDRWTFVIPAQTVEGSGFRKGLIIIANLEAQSVFEDSIFWVGSELDWK